jgi:hypothetical protein
VAERDNHPQLSGDGYEIWHLGFTDSGSGQGFWIRLTREAGAGAVHGSAWFARFDPADPERTFGIHRRSATPPEAMRPADGFVSGPGASMRSGAAEGALEGDGHRVEWSLTWRTGPDTYLPLPAWMQRTRATPFRAFQPNVDTAVSGTITVDGERLEVRDAPGEQGHVVGRRYPRRWAWAHCGDFDQLPGVIEVLTVELPTGPLSAVYATSVGVLWDGRWIRLSGTGRRRSYGLGTSKVDVADRRYRLTGRVEAPARDLLAARYDGPDEAPRFVYHTEIASSRLVLFERTSGAFEEVALFESKGTTRAEWAGMTPAAAVDRRHVDVTG